MSARVLIMAALVQGCSLIIRGEDCLVDGDCAALVVYSGLVVRDAGDALERLQPRDDRAGITLRTGWTGRPGRTG